MNEPSQTGNNSDPVGQQAVAREQKFARTKNFWRRFWIALALSPFVVPLLFYGCVRITHPNAGPQNIRVSKETTHVTEPLDDEDHVDFVAALNQLAGEGVTAENNAAVLLMQAFGPDESMSPDFQAAFFRELKMPVPPADGPYFLTRDAFIEKYPELKPVPAEPGDDIDTSNWTVYEREKEERELRIEAELNALIRQRDWATFHAKLAEIPPPWQRTDETFHRQTVIAMSYPWQTEDYPAIATWLQDNERPLAEVIQASRRTRFFLPLVSDAPALRILLAQGGYTNKLRVASYAIAARAMLHLGEGSSAAAWGDLLAVHRLARLAGQQPTLIGVLDSYGIEAVALEADKSLIYHAELTPDLAARIRSDFESLPPLADVKESINIGERLAFLDSVISFAGHGLVDDNGEEQPMTFSQHWNNSLVNWNNVLTDANRIYDEIVNATGTPFVEVEETIATGQHPLTVATSAFAGFQREKVVKSHLYRMIGVGLNAGFIAQRRTTEHVTLTQVAFAITHYRVEHDENPASLESLVPKYLPSIPTDASLKQPFSYRIDKDGFVVYGWGTDGIDDGGLSQSRWETEDDESPGEYDFVVEIPNRINVRYLDLVGP